MRRQEVETGNNWKKTKRKEAEVDRGRNYIYMDNTPSGFWLYNDTAKAMKSCEWDRDNQKASHIMVILINTSLIN